jgi:hypothetical protein
MKIGELFEPVEAVGAEGIRSRRRITITGMRGKQATLMPGQMVSASSILAGVSGKWIIDHLGDEVPTSWVVS